MVNRLVAPLLGLLFVLFAQPALAFWDPPYITPASPVAGEIVSLNLHGGICDATAALDGFPRITQVGNAITVQEFGFHYEDGSDLCIYGIGTLTEPIGALPPGDYTVSAQLAYYDGFGVPSYLTIGTVAFTVRAPMATPQGAPAASALSLALLFAALCIACGLALRKRSTRSILPALLLAALAQNSTAGPPNLTIQVLLNNSPGAPTPADLIAYCAASPRSPTPPLHAFTVKSPDACYYLIPDPDRATGDFLAWLSANPHSARKLLEDYTVMTFPLVSDIPTALAALRADPFVAEANEPAATEYSSVSLVQFSVGSQTLPLVGSVGQYGRDDLNIDAAWRLAGGYALVGQIDMGVSVNHEALQQFSGASYAGGNFISVLSDDVGLTASPDQSGFVRSNVDEAKLQLVPVSPCSPGTATLKTPEHYGHGTHVAGLLAANGLSGQGVEGTCKNCGVAVWKNSYLSCITSVNPAQVLPSFNDNGANRAKAQAVDIGVQMLSLSLGVANAANTYNCNSFRKDPRCLTIAYAASRDAPMIASSGNKRQNLDFPASDSRVISAGGFQQSGTSFLFWDDAPSCPASPYTGECGSNYSALLSGSYLSHQELLASAKHVLSTTYKNANYVDYAECGDSYGTAAGDSVGWCTGTSMSAPQIAGVVGILRSINPLVPTSQPVPPAGTYPGLRSVLAQSGSQHGSWDAKLGYGVPDAALAASKMLGTVGGRPARNRATPLFRLRNNFSKDYADTTSPQLALSMLIAQTHKYAVYDAAPPIPPAVSPTVVPGYSFPYTPLGSPHPLDIYEETPPPTALAPVYVLTTEFTPRSQYPLIPLYMMRKATGSGFDYLLSTPADLNALHGTAYGYDLLTIQGYVYAPCPTAFEAGCRPPGTQPFYRACKAADNDCATFLGTELVAFSTYNITKPVISGATKTLLGYAYPYGDSDGDGLPDALEYVIGTNPANTDSDGDGIADGVEYPFTGVPVTDPCAGLTGTGARFCPADIIFANGFNP